MTHSSAVGFLAHALCLVACVSASGTGDVKEEEPAVVSKADAESAVEDAKTSTNKTCVKAESNIDSAQRLLEKVETLKGQAEAVKVQADLVPKDNNEVAAIVNSIHSIYNTVIEFCTEANEKINNAITTLDTTLKSAKLLKDASNIEIPEAETAAKEYTTIRTNALERKRQAEDLDNSITGEVGKISEVQSTAGTMEEKAKEAQLKNSHARGIVAVSKIDAMIGKANGILTNTQTQRDAVNDIVQNMQKHCRNDLVDSYDIIKEQCNSANFEFTKAKAAAEEAQNAMTAMKEQKGFADAALKNVQKEGTVLSAAEEEVTKAEKCVSAAQQSFLQLQSALLTGKSYVTKAKDSQQKLVAALSTTTSAPTFEEVKETNKSDLSVLEGTGPATKDATIQPTTTDTEQPTSKESLNQGKNSEEKLKDALSKGAQNVPTTALTGGKAPAPGAKNDSAMTVSVPLLVALIASAVWQ